MKNHAALMIFVLFVKTTLGLDSVPDRACAGTNIRESVPSNKKDHYKQLKKRYTNCTYVEGNLEITWLSEFDLSFLENIRISHIDLPKLDLPKLKVIRGETLFKLKMYKNEFALFVTVNQILTLGMSALKDISNGSVGIYNNYNLCHVKTINYDEIISGLGCSFTFVYNFTSPERVCPVCDDSCEQGCWGGGPGNCQRFSKINCSPRCSHSRCFGLNAHDCCPANCIGGCTGPKATDCIACRYAKNNGECVSTCPQDKPFFAGNCGAVKSTDGTCKVPDDSSILNSEDIDKYKGCTIIEGSLDIGMKASEDINKFTAIFPLALVSVLCILTSLRNLEIIGGNEPMLFSLYIVGSSLTSLGLRSLKKIESGFVTIKDNKNLCYASTLDWKAIEHSKDYEIEVSRNRDENDCITDGLVCDDECSMQGCWGSGPDECISCKNVILDGVCATNCNNSRVYTTGYHMCKTCPEEDHYFEVNTRHCGSCDPQCQGCHGPGPSNCIKCKNYKLFTNANDIKNQSVVFTCVEKCPMDHLTGLCFDKSFTYPLDIEPKSNALDDFVIVDTKAINNYRPHHDESSGICTGSNSDQCNACKHVRNSHLDFLKTFAQYQRVRSD